MRQLLAAVWVLFGWLVVSYAWAGTVDWQVHNQRLNVAEHVYYVQEPPAGLSFAEVRQLPEQTWTENTADTVSLGYGSDVYWFRLSVVSRTPTIVPTFLEIAYAVLDDVQAYVVQGQSVAGQYTMGDKKPFYDRPINHRNFVIPLELWPGETTTVYLRVDTTSSMQVPLTLWSEDAFYTSDQSVNIFEGVYYGIFLVMILYNLFVYMAMGERSFLYYVCYITAMPLFMASLRGTGFQYLWPEATWWNDQAIIVFLNLTMCFGAVFTVRFLSIRATSTPVMYRVSLPLTVLSGLMALAGLVLPYSGLIVPTIIMAFVYCVLMLVFGCIRWYQKHPAARFYTVAWVFWLSGGVILGLSKFTLLPRNFFTENATQIGSALGVILLSIALADRLNKEKRAAFLAQQRLLREERKVRLAQEKSLHVQQEANAQLEARVQERTRDLEKLNAQLLELSATDGLTSLKNRAHFDTAFQSAVVHGFRFEEPVSLLVLDIDHFKKFNDTYGHLVGDDCLKMVASTIRQHVTRPQDLAARYGGEEFVILLPNTPEEGALRVAERIRAEVENTGFRVSGETVHLTVSIGVCTMLPTEADATKELFRLADEALYEAKGDGRNRVVPWRASGQPVDNPPLTPA
ncbi:sensor domain-containing diguanylate cyclase [Marinobacter salinisoli]|uniref:sensor domain-containing diguanylate cyclase n=1 Tax=Marinobacter salinisoli TaxID=2769486 RepID=UPI001D17FAC0|nr:diguanylate cyclase [Marinobacter salinisoli]